MLHLWPAANRREAVQAAQAAQQQEVKEQLPLLDWAQKYRPMLVPDRPFDLASHKYLEAIYSDTAQKVVVCKAAQMGISEYLLSYALHSCDQRNATCLYVFPTEGLISDFSAARLGPAIEVSEYLKSIVRDGSGATRGADRITLKRIRNRFLYLRGGQVKPDGSSATLKTVDADTLIIDELDECDQRVLSIAGKRLAHSALADVRLVSTPTYAGMGIHAEYLASDQRDWFIPCPHCGERQPVTIKNVVTEFDDNDRPVAWNGDDNPFAACAKCSGKLDLTLSGEWIAAYPSRPTHGYHVKRFFGPTVDLASIIDGLRSWNETKVKETNNQDLGEPHQARGSRMTDGDLDACVRDYGHGIDRSRRCYMGIDVGRVLHCVVRQEPDQETGERKQLYAGTVDWQEVGRLILRYAPACVVSDGLPETTKARELQADFSPGLIWLCYYGEGSATNQKNDFLQWDLQQGRVIADRTRSLDEMYDRVYTEVNTLPASIANVADYYDQLKELQRTVEGKRDGTQVSRYIGAGADHWAHAENYASIASHYTPPRRPRGAVAGKLDY